ncbi:MAG: hypothetical protein ACR2OL_09155 [Anderseniella sp.]
MAAYTAITNGDIDRCIRYGPDFLDSSFVRDNQYLLSKPRGAGYWVWKPHIILHAMTLVDEEDVIIYGDSGSLFTGSLAPFVETCRQLKDGIMGFEVGKGYVERHWTKRDAFVLMDCDRGEYWNSLQLRGGTMVFRNCPASRQFVTGWMKLARQVRLVSDWPSLCGQPELDGFRGHRHDQSLFSLMYKKRGYRSYESLTGKQVGDIVHSHMLAEPSLLTMLPSFTYPAMYRKDARALLRAS